MLRSHKYGIFVKQLSSTPFPLQTRERDQFARHRLGWLGPRQTIPRPLRGYYEQAMQFWALVRTQTGTPPLLAAPVAPNHRPRKLRPPLRHLSIVLRPTTPRPLHDR